MAATGLNRRVRRSALASVAGIVSLCIVHSAAAGPIRWESASWNQPVATTPGGWFTSTDRGTTVIGRADAAYPSQAYLEAKYCTPFGGDTHLVGMRITRTRWHSTAKDMNGSVVVFTPQRRYRGVQGGLSGQSTTQRFLKNQVIDGVDLELKARTPLSDTYRFPGGSCVASRVAVRGNDDRVVDTPGFMPHVSQRLTGVLVEDLRGPSVAQVAVPAGWITDDSMVASWNSADNAYRRGTTGVRVVGGGASDRGNLLNGRHTATVSLGSVSDGRNEVCAYRRGSGWAESRVCSTILVDRTNPEVPPVALAPVSAAYVPGPVTVMSGPAQDGAGSGWSHNELRVDGGDWHRATGNDEIATDGEHTVEVRAVDRAGRAGAPSALHTVRIDRTPPTVDNLHADGTTGILSWSMTDAIGFGACPVVVRMSGPGTNGALITAAERAAASFTPGSAQLMLPVGALANGLYDVVLSVCDGAGNRQSVGTTLRWTGNPDGVLIGSWARFVTARISSPGTRLRRLVGGTPVPRVRRVVNRAFEMTGRLRRPDGSAFSHVAMEVRDSRGRYRGGFRTGATGLFRLRTRAVIGGAWTIGPVGSRFRRPVAWLEVRPVVRTRSRMTSGRRVLVVDGRMTPGLGVRGKAVGLQWYDTVSHRWRPVALRRLNRLGRFRFVYRFTRPGRYSLTVRVIVPRDSGWPYLTAYSRLMRVDVG